MTDGGSAVCPGPVWTPLQPAAMDKEKMKNWHNSPGKFDFPVLYYEDAT